MVRIQCSDNNTAHTFITQPTLETVSMSNVPVSTSIIFHPSPLPRVHVAPMLADGRDHVGTIANGSETKCPQVSLPLSHSPAEAAVKMDKKLQPGRLDAYEDPDEN